MRQFEFGAEQAFAAGHLAFVNFMIVAGKMEQTVKDEDLDFRGERMALFGGLTQSRGHADSEIAGDAVCAEAFCWKREHVGSFVFAPELTIEFADCGIRGEQDCDLAAQAYGGLRSAEKSGQRARGRQLEIAA